MIKNITYGIYIYEQVAELDFVAPLQVFAASNQIAGGGRVVTVSGTTGPLCGLGGLRSRAQAIGPGRSKPSGVPAGRLCAKCRLVHSSSAVRL